LQTTRVVLKAPTGVSNVHTIKGRAVNVNNDGTVALEADEARARLITQDHVRHR
jgi:hypothetical protein